MAEKKDFSKVLSLFNWKDNPRAIKQDRFEELKNRIKRHGQIKPLIITEEGEVLGGNMRLKAFQELGIEEAWVSVVHPKNEAEKIEIALTDNEEMGYYEDQALAELIDKYKDDIDLTKYSVHLSQPKSLDEILKEFSPDIKDSYSLKDIFIIPPFSVLDARLGDWQDRKKDWLSIGIKSELGREKNIMKATKAPSYQSGTNTHIAPSTSVFDPVLCEISYKWFNVKGGSVLDPFSGGSVRGVVAEKLGYKYTGIELSKDQVEANRVQAKDIGVSPTWIQGDSNAELDKIDDKYDMVFSCPPYEDLEVYSDDPADISNMSHDDFNQAYKSIIKKAVSKLKDDGFVVWVVGEVRGKKGFYNLLIPNTVKFFEEAGANFYNEVVLVTANGTAGMRAKRSFQSGRKVVKTHQNVLVFYKGDPKKIKGKFGDVDVDELPID